jgi:hypothetical protein
LLDLPSFLPRWQPAWVAVVLVKHQQAVKDPMASARRACLAAANVMCEKSQLSVPGALPPLQAPHGPISCKSFSIRPHRPESWPSRSDHKTSGRPVAGLPSRTRRRDVAKRNARSGKVENAAVAATERPLTRLVARALLAPQPSPTAIRSSRGDGRDVDRATRQANQNLGETRWS